MIGEDKLIHFSGQLVTTWQCDVFCDMRSACFSGQWCCPVL
jgi:hypothetical protein